MRWCAVAVLVSSACGRLAFDPTSTTATGDARGDGVADSTVIVPDVPAGTIRLTPSADTYIFGTDMSANGTLAALFVGRNSGNGANQWALFQFDLSQVPVAAVSKATLRMQTGAFSGSSTMNIEVYRLTEPWNELEATWDFSVGSTSWATPGGTIAPTIYAVTTVSLTVVGAYEWDLTTLVNGWIIGGVANYGIELQYETQPPAGTGVAFHSREHPSDQNRPELLIAP